MTQKGLIHCKTTNQPVVSYNIIRLCWISVIVRIPDQDIVTSYNLLLYWQLSSDKILIQWQKIWINWQDDSHHTEREQQKNFYEIHWLSQLIQCC